MVISLFIDPMNSHHHNDKDNREIQGKMIHEGDDQVTTPPKTTDSITRIPHLIWVMGKLSFSLLFSHSLVLHYSRQATEILITFVKYVFQVALEAQNQR